MVTTEVITSLRDFAKQPDYLVEVWKAHTKGVRKTSTTKLKTDLEQSK